MKCSQAVCILPASFLVVTEGVMGDTSFLVAEALCQGHQWGRSAQAKKGRYPCRVNVLPRNLLLLRPLLYVNGVECDYAALGGFDALEKPHPS